MSPRTESNASAAAVPEPPASAMVSSSSGGSPSWAWTQSFPFGAAILSASVTAARLVAVFFSGFLLLPGQPLSPPLRPELPTLRAPRLRPGPPRLLPPGPPLGLGGHEDPANPLGCGHGEAPASFSARPTGRVIRLLQPLPPRASQCVLGSVVLGSHHRGIGPGKKCTN